MFQVHILLYHLKRLFLFIHLQFDSRIILISINIFFMISAFKYYIVDWLYNEQQTHQLIIALHESNIFHTGKFRLDSILVLSVEMVTFNFSHFHSPQIHFHIVEQCDSNKANKLVDRYVYMLSHAEKVQLKFYSHWLLIIIIS